MKCIVYELIQILHKGLPKTCQIRTIEIRAELLRETAVGIFYELTDLTYTILLAEFVTFLIIQR